MPSIQTTTFAVAMKQFFGLLPDQKLSEFSQELKALTPEDREYFIRGLEQNGYHIQRQ